MVLRLAELLDEDLVGVVVLLLVSVTGATSTTFPA